MTAHKEFLCCHEGCAGIICLSPAQEARMRETHEDFRCPFGHVQGFYGKSDKEKKIERLEQQLKFEREVKAWKNERIAELQHELRSLRSKLAWRDRRLRLVKDEEAA